MAVRLTDQRDDGIGSPKGNRKLFRTRGRVRHRIAVAIACTIVAGGAAAGGASLAASGNPAHRSPAVGAAPAAPAAIQAENRSIDRVLAYTPFVSAGGGRKREIALTFDDGPGPYTPRVLAVLERTHTPATFFEIGSMERWFGGSTQAEIKHGFVVGSHTENHEPMGKLGAAAQEAQLTEQAKAIESHGAPAPRLFRPPNGSFDRTPLSELRGKRMLMVLWTVDTEDWKQPGADAIVDRAVSGARPGAIILMHDAGGNRSETVSALPRIISALRARDYGLVTVPQLLADDPPPHGQPIPWALGSS